jgi:hypothetical protein
MNSLVGLDSSHKSTPNYTALFSVVAILLVAIAEKIGDFECNLSEKVVFEGWVVEHAAVEEYGGPVDGRESRDYFHIGCPSLSGRLIGYT